MRWMLLCGVAWAGGCDSSLRPVTSGSIPWELQLADGDTARLGFTYTWTTSDDAFLSEGATRLWGRDTYLSGRLAVHEIDGPSGEVAPENQVSELAFGYTRADDDGTLFLGERFPLPLQTGTHTLYLAFVLDGWDLDVTGDLDFALTSDDPSHRFTVERLDLR